MGERRGLWKAFAGVAVMGCGVLALVIVAGVGLLYFSVRDVQARSRVEITQLMMGRVAQQVELHAMRQALPDDLAEVFPDGVPTDGWDRPYQLEVPGRGEAEFDILSLGADGQPGGDGYDADLRYTDEV